MKSISAILRFFILSFTMFYCTSVRAQDKSLKNAAGQWQQAMDLKKPELITSYFDTSIIAIYHSNPVVSGKEINLKIWQHQFDDSLDQHPITIEKVEVSSSGDMGYVLGKWWSIHPADNYYNGGRYVSIWRLKNNEWRIVMLSVNIQEDVKAEKKLK